MTAFWNAIGDSFQAIFSVMNGMSSWFNKLLIVVGFVAFFIWVWYSTRQKEVEKFD